MKYLLDSNVLIDFVKGKKKVVANIKRYSEGDLCTSIIVVGEIKTGMQFQDKRSKEYKIYSTLLERIQVLYITDEIMENFARTKAKMIKEGNKIQDLDMLIGCTALSFGCTLVTHNVKHFSRIHRLKLKDWNI